MVRDGVNGADDAGAFFLKFLENLEFINYFMFEDN